MTPSDLLRKIAAQAEGLDLGKSASITAWRTTAEAALVDTLTEGHTFVRRFRDIEWHYRGGLTTIGRDPYRLMEDIQEAALRADQLARRQARDQTRALLVAAADYIDQTSR